MKPENRQKSLLIAAGCVVGLYLLDTVVVSPLTESWKTRSAEIAKLRKDIEQGREMLKREKDTRDRWNEVRKNSLSFDVSQAQQELIGSFNKWSQDSRVTVTSTKPMWKHGVSERGSGDEYSLLECRVDAAGSMSTLARFLYEVERSPMALKIEGAEFTTRDNNGGQVALGLVVTGLRLKQLEGK